MLYSVADSYRNRTYDGGPRNYRMLAEQPEQYDTLQSVFLCWATEIHRKSDATVTTLQRHAGELT